MASFSVSLKQKSPLALGTGAGEKFPAGKNIGKKKIKNFHQVFDGILNRC